MPLPMPALALGDFLLCKQHFDHFDLLRCAGSNLMILKFRSQQVTSCDQCSDPKEAHQKSHAKPSTLKAPLAQPNDDKHGAWLATGGAGPLAEVLDARELLTAALSIYDAGLGLRHPIVRLLGCEQDPHSDQLLALGSSEGGVVAAFPVSYPESGSPAGSFSFQPPTYVLEGGHQEVGLDSAKASFETCSAGKTSMRGSI